MPDFEILLQRHEKARSCRNATALGADDAVAHAVAASVLLRIGVGGLPGGRPVIARLVVAHIDVASPQVEGDIVIPVARDAAQARVAIERVTTRGVGDDAEVSLASQIVDPWQGCIWPGDYIFPVLVVEVSVLHK